MVEQRIENPCVTSSILVPGKILTFFESDTADSRSVEQQTVLNNGSKALRDASLRSLKPELFDFFYGGTKSSPDFSILSKYDLSKRKTCFRIALNNGGSNPENEEKTKANASLRGCSNGIEAVVLGQTTGSRRFFALNHRSRRRSRSRASFLFHGHVTLSVDETRIHPCDDRLALKSF